MWKSRKIEVVKGKKKVGSETFEKSKNIEVEKGKNKKVESKKFGNIKNIEVEKEKK